jgi:glycosyltransferase involved in cell wall biosynthesis
VIVGIFGRHPVPQPGFMGVMSLFEAIHFSRMGHYVELLIPFADNDSYMQFLKTNNLKNLNSLTKLHGHFSILPLLKHSSTPRNYDVIIFQSYDPSDVDDYFQQLRSQCTIITKNFPKFVPSAEFVWHESVESTLKTFDLVACALKDDVAEMRSDIEFWSTYSHKIAYVPRGAEPSLLHPARKLGSRPTIGIEIPLLVENMEAIQHYVEPIRRLQADNPELRVLTLGRFPHPEIKSEHIFYGQFDMIYEKFFNEIWLHLIMDYRKSSVHVSAPVQKLHPRDWSARAIYEVQNIEAQMAGCVIIGHVDNVILELVNLGTSCLLYKDYNDGDEIFSIMSAALEHFPRLSIESRRWAVENFTWESCMQKWADALRLVLSTRSPTLLTR